jgi:anti-sigma factor RsiW
MLPDDRLIAGVWCSEVLEHLSEFLDGELPPDTLALAQAHVAECTTCAAFGARFATAVAALKALPAADPLEASVAERLRVRLAAAR